MKVIWECNGLVLMLMEMSVNKQIGRLSYVTSRWLGEIKIIEARDMPLQKVHE